jgi:WD40 repeat protein
MLSGKCEGKMQGHTGYVSSLILQDDFVVSASYDSTMCLWSSKRMTLLKQIKAHEHCVNSLMAHDSGVLLSASWDGTIRVWDLRMDSTPQSRSFASVLVVCLC